MIATAGVCAPITPARRVCPSLSLRATMERNAYTKTTKRSTIWGTALRAARISALAIRLLTPNVPISLVEPRVSVATRAGWIQLASHTLTRNVSIPTYCQERLHLTSDVTMVDFVPCPTSVRMEHRRHGVAPVDQ